jgi:hypothetical protein
VALLVGLLTAPSAARATCGNYVVTGHRAVAHSPEPGAASGAPTVSHPFDQPTPMPLPRGSPCTGTSCSGGPIPLPADSGSMSQTQDRELGCLACWAGAGADFQRSLVTESSRLSPIRRPLPLYDPPR